MVLPRLTVLDERYAIGGVLDDSSPFIVAYQAWNLASEQQVDLCEFFPSALARRAEGGLRVEPRQAADADTLRYGRTQFLKEAGVLATLDHPNLERLLDRFEAHGTAYRVLAHHAGAPLASVLDRQDEGLDLRAGLSILMPILDGLRAAHERGLIHGAVSPDTIFLSKTTGGPVLRGFRTAHLMLAQRTGDLASMVEKGRSAPEQYAPEGHQGPWTDVYGCAAALYEVLTGVRLPDAPRRRDQDDVPALLRTLPDLPDGLIDVLQAALSLEPARRPRSVDMFRKLLQDAARDKPAVTVPDPVESVPEDEPTPAPSDEPVTIETPSRPPSVPGGEELTVEEASSSSSMAADEAPIIEKPPTLPSTPADDTADTDEADARSIGDPEPIGEMEAGRGSFDVDAPEMHLELHQPAVPEPEDEVPVEDPEPVVPDDEPDEAHPMDDRAVRHEVARTAVVASRAEAEEVSVSERPDARAPVAVDLVREPGGDGASTPTVSAWLQAARPSQLKGHWGWHALTVLGVVLLAALAGAYFGVFDREHEPDLYAVYRTQGDSLFHEANYASAVAQYERALSARPSDDYVHTRLDETRQRLAQVSEPRYRRFLAQGDSLYGQADSLLEAGMALAALNLFAKANEAYYEALTYQPEDTLMLGKGQRTIERMNEAVQRNRAQQRAEAQAAEQDEALSADEVQEQRFERYRREGDAAFEQGDYETARVRYAQALAQRPGDAGVGARMEEIDALVEQQEQEQQLRQHLDEGARLVEEERLDEARAAFQRALGLDPENQEARNGLSRIASVQNTAQQNEQQYQRFRTQGDDLAARGRYEEALVQYRQALSFKTGDTYVTQQIEATEQAAREKARVLSTRNAEDGVYKVVDEPPQLIGGLEGLHKQVRYPEKAVQAGISGRVYVQFVVDENGAVLNPSVLRGIGGGCDEEALRVIQQAHFEPGKIDGRPVKTQHTLFIVFSSEREEEEE